MTEALYEAGYGSSSRFYAEGARAPRHGARSLPDGGGGSAHPVRVGRVLAGLRSWSRPPRGRLRDPARRRPRRPACATCRIAFPRADFDWRRPDFERWMAAGHRLRRGAGQRPRPAPRHPRHRLPAAGLGGAARHPGRARRRPTRRSPAPSARRRRCGRSPAPAAPTRSRSPSPATGWCAPTARCRAIAGASSASARCSTGRPGAEARPSDDLRQVRRNRRRNRRHPGLRPALRADRRTPRGRPGTPLACRRRAEAAAGRPEPSGSVRARDQGAPRPGIDGGAALPTKAAQTSGSAAGLGAEASGQLVGQVAQIQPVAVPLEPRGIRLRRLGSKAVLDPQPLDREIAVPRDRGGQHRPHAPGARNPRARPARHRVAGADVETGAGPADIGLDRDPLETGRKRQPHLRRVGHGEHIARRRAGHQGALARRQGIGPREAQGADAEAVRATAHRAGDAVRAGLPRLDQARHDHAVRPPQAAHGDPRARLPRRRRDPRSRPAAPARSGRPGATACTGPTTSLVTSIRRVARPPPSGRATTWTTCPIFRSPGLRGRAVDAHLHLGRIGDAQVVDDDRAEAADRADHPGPADAAVALAEGSALRLVGPHHAGAADTLVARRFLAAGRRPAAGRGAREQAKDEPAIGRRGHRPGSHGRPRAAPGARLPCRRRDRSSSDACRPGRSGRPRALPGWPAAGPPWRFRGRGPRAWSRAPWTARHSGPPAPGTAASRRRCWRPPRRYGRAGCGRNSRAAAPRRRRPGARRRPRPARSGPADP